VRVLTNPIAGDTAYTYSYLNF